MRSVKNIGRVLLWIVQILGGIAFIAIGIAKFRSPFWIAMFARWGYAGWFRELIGVLEALGGAALIVPRVASYGGSLIAAIMVGATATQLLNGEPRQVFAPVFWLLVVAIVALARYPDALRPASPASDAVPLERV
jgi:putative oxidoreductase